ncbi:Bug family tripartite tricarboxylate transporter substrate binding protein [Roseomonas xinghualingensis]|uniref:Bug family tripartite tricarboxylate transporter substrate binding protein n=1 Tax=Roseomonas xinghualingensis TaxID=2986475 RepID=UPI0021F1DD19|nr:tripartite tricarboxylate transporter substrate-binding protein [Roseomonas sp. SXEYE001]MCV4208452.1 tripartite tricarboxylate transporter substrate-binding protein [Roseomonas sp. SXEYE001]
MFRRTLLAATPAVLAAPTIRPAWAQAGSFNRPLRLIVPFAAGGTSDILARLIAPKLGEALGQSVVVENRSGANGNIGADAVAKAAKDGHTLLLTDAASLAIAPALVSNLSYSPMRDLAPVTVVAFAPYIVAVHPSVEANSLDELAALAKRRKLNLAHSGVGSGPHMTALVLGKQAGIEWEYVPYRGGAPAVQAVAQGDCQAVVNGATATQPFVTSGQLKALAVSGTARLPALPDKPTFAELKMPEMLVQSGTWQGLFTAAGTPEAMVSALNRAVAAALRDPPTAARIGEIGGEVRTTSPEEFGRWFAGNTEAWGRVVRENDVRME